MMVVSSREWYDTYSLTEYEELKQDSHIRVEHNNSKVGKSNVKKGMVMHLQ